MTPSNSGDAVCMVYGKYFKSFVMAVNQQALSCKTRKVVLGNVLTSDIETASAGSTIHYKFEYSSETEPKKSESKIKPAMRYLKAKKKGLFSKVGVEPTFYPSFDFPDKYTKGIAWVNLFDNIVDYFLKAYKHYTGHSWIDSKAYNDGSALEIPTAYEYTDEKALLNDYKRLLKIVNEFGFKPTSVVQPDSDGGCHINFDLSDRRDLYGTDVVNMFCRNVLGFLNNNPTLVWGFLHYEDTESSRIITIDDADPYSATCKGMCVNLPNLPSSDNFYIEMRAFSMPRTIGEFQFHLDFCNKLLKYVWNKTIMNPNKPMIERWNSSYDLQRYKWPRAKDEFTSALFLLGVDIKKAKYYDKFANLYERILKGKSYLS